MCELTGSLGTEIDYERNSSIVDKHWTGLWKYGDDIDE